MTKFQASWEAVDKEFERRNVWFPDSAIEAVRKGSPTYKIAGFLYQVAPPMSDVIASVLSSLGETVKQPLRNR